MRSWSSTAWIIPRQTRAGALSAIVIGRHFPLCSQDSRACVLLPGHWIEPSRAGLRDHDAVHDVAQHLPHIAQHFGRRLHTTTLSLIPVRGQLHARVVRIVEVQLIAAARAIRRIVINGRFHALLPQALRGRRDLQPRACGPPLVSTIVKPVRSC